VEPGQQYAIYLFGGSEVELSVELPGGKYMAEWVQVVSGKIDRREQLNHPGGPARLKSPRFQEDIALRVVREQ
jgi:hypothetical protein